MTLSASSRESPIQIRPWIPRQIKLVFAWSTPHGDPGVAAGAFNPLGHPQLFTI